MNIVAWGQSPADSRSKYVWTYLDVDGEMMMFVNDQYQSQSPSMTVTNNAETVVKELNDELYAQGIDADIAEIIYCDTERSWDRFNADTGRFSPCDNKWVENIFNRIYES